MTKLTSKLTLAASLLAVACAFTVPVVRAADEKDAAAEKAAKKKKREDDALKKYDKNANGKWDPDEEAARKADADKAKAEKEKKKKESGS